MGGGEGLRHCVGAQVSVNAGMPKGEWKLRLFLDDGVLGCWCLECVRLWV